MKLSISISVLCILFFIGCNSSTDNSNDDCNRDVGQGDKYIGFMMEGGFADQYNEGKVYYSIVHIIDYKDWQYNEYFTGNGFSRDETKAAKILDKDSCLLKKLYFTYLNK